MSYFISIYRADGRPFAIGAFSARSFATAADAVVAARAYIESKRKHRLGFLVTGPLGLAHSELL